MSGFDRIVLTNKGIALNTKVGVGSTLLNLTNVATSETIYLESELQTLESINVKQSASIASKSALDNRNIKISVAFTSENLDTGYFVRTVGIYANDPNYGEILYAVVQETSGNCYLSNISGLNLNFLLTVDSIENVDFEVSQEAVVPISEFNILKKDVEIMKTGYDEFTMEIDGYNFSNPSVENGGIKYRGGCEKFTKEDWIEWLGYKPCILYSQGKVECYLNPNNYSEDVNGNTVDISTVSDTPRNVMIKHNRIGIMSTTVKNGEWIIRCTNDPCDERYSYSAFKNGARDCRNIYIGAYNGTILDNKLHSLSGATISANGQSVSTYRALAQANGMNYQLVDIRKFSYLRHLYILQNGTIDGRLSNGFQSSNTTSGKTDELGLNNYDKTLYWGKWLGMETNCFSAYVDGSYVDSNFRLLVAENNNFNNTGSGYIDCGKLYSLGSGYMSTYVTFSPELGFIPNGTKGTSNTLFHAKTAKIVGSTSMVNYGYNIFCSHYTKSPTDTGVGITARLCYMSY